MAGNEYCGNLNELNKVVTITEVADNWVIGKSGDYWFEMKCFRNGSSFGIDGGRISKLHITHNGKEAVQYERGWTMKPSNEHRSFYNKIIKAMQ